MTRALAHLRRAEAIMEKVGYGHSLMYPQTGNTPPRSTNISTKTTNTRTTAHTSPRPSPFQRGLKKDKIVTVFSSHRKPDGVHAILKWHNGAAQVFYEFTVDKNVNDGVDLTLQDSDRQNTLLLHEAQVITTQASTSTQRVPTSIHVRPVRALPHMFKLTSLGKTFLFHVTDWNGSEQNPIVNGEILASLTSNSPHNIKVQLHRPVGSNAQTVLITDSKGLEQKWTCNAKFSEIVDYVKRKKARAAARTTTSAQPQTSRALKVMHLQKGSIVSAIKRNLVEVHYPTRPSKFFYVLWKSEPPYNTHKLHFIVTSISLNEVNLQLLDQRAKDFTFKPYLTKPAVVVEDIRNRFNELLSASWLHENLKQMPSKEEKKEIIDYMKHVLASTENLQTGHGSPQLLNKAKLKASYQSLSNKLFLTVIDIFERPSARGLSIWDEIEQFNLDEDYQRAQDGLKLVQYEIIYFKQQIQDFYVFPPPPPPDSDFTADEDPEDTIF